MYQILKGKENVRIGAAKFDSILKDATMEQLEYLHEEIKHPYVIKKTANGNGKKKQSKESTESEPTAE